MSYINQNPFILFLFFLFISVKSFAQVDASPGTWQMEYEQGQGLPAINIELQIAASEKNILYPACMKIQCGNFNAEYELLLVKKTIRELAISKIKYPVFETPFSLGNFTTFFNGILDYSNGVKGVPTLTISRMQSKQEGISMPDTMHFEKPYRQAAGQLINFLKNVDITFKRINGSPWKDEKAGYILSPSLSPAYFGLQDTIYLQQQDGTLDLTSDKKTESDIVSVATNGNITISQLNLNKKNHEEDITLDTGLNILSLFAENFGGGLPNRGKLNLQFGERKLALAFANKADSAATFIVTELYCVHDKTKDKDFQNYNGHANDVLQKNEKLIGGIVSTSQQLTFAIWDDAVEDGDSISININGKWLVQGFPVKTKVQFITVTLKPGPNLITYIADNLGSIPPNTSVLEIIDGNKRRAYTIETNPDESNLLKIFYDVNGQ